MIKITLKALKGSIFSNRCASSTCFFFHNSRVNKPKILESIRNILNACDTCSNISRPRCRAWSPAKKVWCCNEKKKGANFARGNCWGKEGIDKKLTCPVFIWSNYSDLTRVFTPNGGLVRDIPLFQGNLL